MAGKTPKRHSPTLLGRFLKEYRETHNLNQTQLASYLDVIVGFAWVSDGRLDSASGPLPY